MNKYQKEYIGQTIQTTINKQQINGKIIDETKNTFKVQTQKKIITILKNKKTFLIGNETIEGQKITKKPEERIKIKR